MDINYRSHIALAQVTDKPMDLLFVIYYVNIKKKSIPRGRMIKNLSGFAFGDNTKGL